MKTLTSLFSLPEIQSEEHAVLTHAPNVPAPLDTERDTRERLREFRDAHGLGENWTLLRSEEVDVRTMAALLDVRYRFEADGNIAHSNRITFLDMSSEIIGLRQGVGVDPTS